MSDPIKVNRKPYQWLVDSKKRRNIMWGSASSSKSHTIAQFLCFALFAVLSNIGILIVRKTRPAVKSSCWELITGYLDKAGIPYKPNLSELTIKGTSGGFIKFDGLDNIGKKKSIEGINYVWVEELAGLSVDTRISKREWALLDVICRSPENPKRINQLFASFNPVDPLPNQWIVDITKRGDTPDTQLLHINFEENPFLSEADRATILRNAAEDAAFNKVYRLGQWAVIVGKIYDNWDIVQSMPAEYEKRVWGLDFGFVNPSALIEVRTIGKETYEQEHIYQSGLTNPQLASKIEAIVGPYDSIIADSAQPGDIAELRTAGLNVFPCWKAAGSVNSGIQTVQGFKTHLLDTSVNLIEEKAAYKWVTDVDDLIKLFQGEQKAVDFKNHLMDAERYAINSVARKVKVELVSVGPPDDDIDEDEAMWTVQE